MPDFLQAKRLRTNSPVPKQPNAAGLGRLALESPDTCIVDVSDPIPTSCTLRMWIPVAPNALLPSSSIDFIYLHPLHSPVEISVFLPFGGSLDASAPAPPQKKKKINHNSSSTLRLLDGSISALLIVALDGAAEGRLIAAVDCGWHGATWTL